MWQVAQLRVVGRPMCLAWAPAMLGKAAPAGPWVLKLESGWQERQVPAPLPAARGDALMWHVVQLGPDLPVPGPVSSWQLMHSPLNIASVAVWWVFPVPEVVVIPLRKGAGWAAAPGPFTWQLFALKEELKQPGAPITGEVAPAVTPWQSPQTAARCAVLTAAAAFRWEAV